MYVQPGTAHNRCRATPCHPIVSISGQQQRCGWGCCCLLLPPGSSPVKAPNCSRRPVSQSLAQAIWAPVPSPPLPSPAVIIVTAREEKKVLRRGVSAHARARAGMYHSVKRWSKGDRGLRRFPLGTRLPFFFFFFLFPAFLAGPRNRPTLQPCQTLGRTHASEEGGQLQHPRQHSQGRCTT